MNLKQRLFGTIGAITIAGGMLGVAAPTAGAATVLAACDLTVRARVTDPLGPTEKDTTVTGSEAQPKPETVGGPAVSAENCTGTLQPTVGNLAKASLKFLGHYSCPDLASSSPTRYPFSGALTLTYMNVNPATTKAYTSAAYVRVDPTAADVLDVHGIVTKGAGVGADVSGQLGFAAFADKSYTTALTTPQVSDCVSGGATTIPYLVLFTDGVTPVLGVNVSSEISLTLP